MMRNYGAVGGASYGAANRARGVPKWGGCRMRPPRWGRLWSCLWGHEPREGCAEIGCVPRADFPAGAGGTLHGATNRARGAPKSGVHRMRALLPAPSVELLWANGCAEMG